MGDNRIKIGITMGDINGISYEIVIKTLADPRVLELYTPILYGSAKIASYHRKFIENIENLNLNIITSASEALHKKINIINCVDDSAKVEIGKSTDIAGTCAADALDAATKELQEGLIDAIVTAPINKFNIQSRRFNFTGHTEFFASKFNCEEPLMMMVSDIMKVALVTIHTPIADVPAKITKEAIVNKLRALKHSLIADFAIVEPRIAVLGLNPHAGDNGFIGTEEIDTIIPAINEAKEEKILAFGPYAADGLFGSGAFRKFDAILAMYHDQGLAPFKALSTDGGVNYTAALSVVRTSPAHGVGYDRAGKGIADHCSMNKAIYMAKDIYFNRIRYAEMTADPLKKYARDNGKDIYIKDLPQTESI